MQNLFLMIVACQADEADARDTTQMRETYRGESASSEHPTGGSRSEPAHILGLCDGVVVPKGEEANEFEAKELLALKELRPNPSVDTNADEKGVTAEFPFYDAVSVAEKRAIRDVFSGLGTALFQAKLDEPHEWLGAGCRLTLALPVENAEPRSANDLNMAEARESTRTMFSGGWFVSEGTLTFTTFVPSVMHWEGALRDLFFSFARRSSWAREYLGDRVTNSADDKRDPWTCPICEFSCKSEEPCEHFAVGRSDDSDGSEARGVLNVTNEEVTRAFDELYDVVVQISMDWQAGSRKERKVLNAKMSRLPRECARIQSIIDILPKSKFKAESAYDFEDKVPDAFYDRATDWFTELFKRLWNRQPTAVAADDYVILHSPGYSWSGTNYWATDGENCLTRICQEVDKIAARLREAVRLPDSNR